ncbi:hypothetical protein BDZ97DRAFT_298547 [Flammula alnicola]|nr:hypothetical protein BDZ97DRAFT_298547 [Flammula alnicola]
MKNMRLGCRTEMKLVGDRNTNGGNIIANTVDCRVPKSHLSVAQTFKKYRTESTERPALERITATGFTTMQKITSVLTLLRIRSLHRLVRRFVDTMALGRQSEELPFHFRKARGGVLDSSLRKKLTVRHWDLPDRLKSHGRLILVLISAKHYNFLTKRNFCKGWA